MIKFCKEQKTSKLSWMTKSFDGISSIFRRFQQPGNIDTWTNLFIMFANGYIL